MKRITICLIVLISLLAHADEPFSFGKQGIVKDTIEIRFEQFPNAHNPSIFKFDQGFLFTFRYCPDLYNQPWISNIGVVLLDQNFRPLSEPQILSTRTEVSRIPSQSEDARVFSYRGRLFLIYNDNTEVTYTKFGDRRDMYMVELIYSAGKFSLATPLKLVYEAKYSTQYWQKNWVPFEWNNRLLLAYRVEPHEILYVNFTNGACYQCYETSGNISWDFGVLRGSAPPQLVDGEYLSFFHSGKITASPASNGQELWHYFMGAYTFSRSPPFQITKISPQPIVGEDFYTYTPYYKRVIFPGGFVVSGDSIYVAYGKNDCEMWIATLDKNALMKSLKQVKRLDD